MEGIMFRDRVVEMRRVKASDLHRHPRNPRKHPASQIAAMKGVYEQVGDAGAVVVYEDEGRLVILNGHMRSDINKDEEVSVLVTDLTPQEAEVIIATYDEIGKMADTDQAKLDALIDSVSPENMAVRSLLADIHSLEIIQATEGGQATGGTDGDSDSSDNESDPDSEDSQTPDESCISHHLSFRKFDIPFDADQAATFKAAIDRYCDKVGTSYGFMDQVANRL